MSLQVDRVVPRVLIAVLVLVAQPLLCCAAGTDSQASPRHGRSTAHSSTAAGVVRTLNYRPATGEPASGLQISVFVFNSAHIAARDLMKAEAQAGETFEKLGIKLTWVSGLTVRGAIAHPVGEAWNPANLDLRIWTRRMARGDSIPSNALGYRLSIEQGQAAVFSDSIQNLAAIWGTDAGAILALVMAHEIGHLLLKTSSHSNFGVMEARYLQKDLASAERGGLAFSREESNSMRTEVRQRMRLQMGEGSQSQAVK